MWIKFGDKLTKTGEYTEFEVDHEIGWDDVMVKSELNLDKESVTLEVIFVSPEIKLIKTMLNPVVDRVDTEYDNEIHKDIRRSESRSSHSSLLSSSMHSSRSYSESTVVECKGKMDTYNYRKNYEIENLKLPKQLETLGSREVLKLSVHLDMEQLAKLRGYNYFDSKVYWWLKDHSNDSSIGFHNQDRYATEEGLQVLPGMFPELNIEQVFGEFIEAEKAKAMDELVSRVNKGWRNCQTRNL